MSRICEHCGSDTYFAQEFPRLRDRNASLQRRIESMARENGLLSYQLEAAATDAADRRAGLQRKVSEQAKTIRRLEARLRAAGERAHAGAQINEAVHNGAPPPAGAASQGTESQEG